jgi:multisubunit Na+/H+ antiporter MnhE subunit
VSALARFAAWTALLWLLWLVVVGTTQSTELIAGLIAAAMTSLFVEALHAAGVMRFRMSPTAVASAWSIPGHVLFDFVLVLWIVVREVARRRRIVGGFLEVPFEDEPGRRGRFRRALIAALENESANGMVVDLRDGRALLHSLDTRPSTGKQVM